MRIPCPYCGPRPSEEFTVLGDATKARPTSLEPESQETWFDYVYLRDNPKGRHLEYWHHSGGCRTWLVVERDTATHAVHGVTTAREAAEGRR
jgi:sarcosine oxidase subunit delta